MRPEKSAILELMIVTALVSCAKPDGVMTVDIPALEVEVIDDPILVPVLRSGYYGMADANGRMQVEPRFAQLGIYANNRIPARITGKFGYIDKRGKWKIEPKYDYASSFSEGVATVWIDTIAFIIDTMGSVIHTGIYSYALPCTDGLVTVYAREKVGLVSSKGETLAEPGTLFKVVNRECIVVNNMTVNTRGVNPTISVNWKVVDGRGLVKHLLLGYNDVVASYGSESFAMIKPRHEDSALKCDVYSRKGALNRSLTLDGVDDITCILPCGHLVGHKNVKNLRGKSSHTETKLIDHDGNVVKGFESVDVFQPVGKNTISCRAFSGDNIQVYRCDSTMKLVLVESR